MTDRSIIDKILYADKDVFVIFYVEDCPYCNSARELLKESGVKYKGYNIDKLGGLQHLLKIFNKYGDEIKFNSNHHTKPIVFYNNKFLGGCDDLHLFLKKL